MGTTKMNQITRSLDFDWELHQIQANMLSEILPERQSKQLE
jgi:hypothetical protein